MIDKLLRIAENEKVKFLISPGQGYTSYSIKFGEFEINISSNFPNFIL